MKKRGDLSALSTGKDVREAVGEAGGLDKGDVSCGQAEFQAQAEPGTKTWGQKLT